MGFRRTIISLLVAIMLSACSAAEIKKRVSGGPKFNPGIQKGFDENRKSYAESNVDDQTANSRALAEINNQIGSIDSDIFNIQNKIASFQDLIDLQESIKDESGLLKKEKLTEKISQLEYEERSLLFERQRLDNERFYRTTAQ